MKYSTVQNFSLSGPAYVSADESCLREGWWGAFHCCLAGAGAAGTATFCLSGTGTGTLMHSGFGSGSSINVIQKCQNKELEANFLGINNLMSCHQITDALYIFIGDKNVKI